MRLRGVEPPRLAAQDSKSCVSASFTTTARIRDSGNDPKTSAWKADMLPITPIPLNLQVGKDLHLTILI